MITRIVIVGGGTAGWLTAGILAAGIKKRNDSAASHIAVTLVESPEVPTIGVGEGTWPTMRSTLQNIGISESEFISTCSASFKQGSKFVGWKTGEPGDFYYHPFTLPKAPLGSDFHALWQQHFHSVGFDFLANVQAEICEHSLAPKQITTPEYAGMLNYGYHLDAGKFSELLRRHCVETLNVEHVLDHVEHVESDSSGNIESILLRKREALSGDLFVDCSGSHSLLIGKHFNIPYQDCSHFSPNDTALAMQVPYQDGHSPIASATIATAQSAGWTWDIGLSSRRGLGYVYSSAHISDDRAEQELRSHVALTVEEALVDTLACRRIKINAGYRQTFFYKNCVAVGMSAGFIEPLEASALALVELSANFIRDELVESKSLLPILAERFNAVFSYRWERIIEFLKLHYALSLRRDTEYWCDVTQADSMPNGLRNLLALWRYRSPYFRDFLQVEEIFPSASYQYVLYGMGFETHSSLNTDECAVRELQKNMASLDKYLDAMPSTRELLNRIAEHGLKAV